MAAIGGLAQLLGWTSVSIAALGLAALGGIGRILIAWRQWKIEGEREQAALDRRLHVRVTDISDISPTDIGVDPAAQSMIPGGEIPRYLPRHIDGLLGQALARALDGDGAGIIVVRGPSKVGKSRTLFEALLGLSDRGRPLKLISPVDGDAVRSLLSPDEGVDTSGSPAVLWLDDLENFVAEGVSLDVLREWHERKEVVIAATYGGKGSDLVRDTSTSELTVLTQRILSHAQEVGLDVTDASELESLSNVSSLDREIVKDYGLAAAMVAAPALQRTLDTRQHLTGEKESHEGAAVVYAAVDWARCGRTDPISAERLRRLWPTYLPSGVEATDEIFAAGLEWALQPVAGRIALLVSKEGFRPYDYVVRSISDRPDARVPPDNAWTCALDTDDALQVFNVSSNAYREGKLDLAVLGMTIASRDPDSGLVALATSNLGFLLKRQGDLTAAEAAYRKAIALGSGEGAFNLGILLQEQDDLEGAETAWLKAIELGDGRGGANLGVMLESRGDLEGAEAVYRSVIDMGGEVGGSAAFNLGLLRHKQGDPEGAEEAYRTSAELDWGDGASNLGALLVQAGDSEGAEKAFRRAIELGDGTGAFNLGIMREKLGDEDGAEAAYRIGIELDSGDAASNLGALLQQRGDLKGAETAWHKAVEMGNAPGTYNLGYLLWKKGELDGARRAFREAAESDEADVALQARFALKKLLRDDVIGEEI